MSGPTDQDLEDLALELVTEAVASLRGHATEEQLKDIEAKMLLELVGTPAGRLHLRRCFEDPAVNRSGPRATEAAPATTVGTEDKEQAS